MNTQTHILPKLQPLERFLSKEETTRQILAPAAMFPDEIDHVIPSVVVSGGGTALQSVFLISKKFICEIRIEAKNDALNFDFALNGEMHNYRFQERSVEIRDGETVQARFETAQIDVLQAKPIGYACQFFFAGTKDERSKWIKNVMEAIPFGLRLP